MTERSSIMRGPAFWAGLAAVLVTVSVLGVFLVAPEDADQGIIQKIFYFHVGLAMGAYVAFAVAAGVGIAYMRGRAERWDEVGSASIGIGLLFSALVIVTGSIWAKASWGVWWDWADVRLVTFAVVLLLYAGYFVLRSSAEPGAQARIGALYAIVAFVSVPVSFMSVRVSDSKVHPIVTDSGGPDLPGSMLVWMVLSIVAMIAVYGALLSLELAQRRTERTLRRLRLRLEAS